MQVTAIKTAKITPGAMSLDQVVDGALPTISEGNIVVVTSKIVSICEGSVVPCDQIDKERLIVQEADMYLPKELGRYGYHFSIRNNTLTAAAGIDESNSDGHYVLWPKDSQATANHLREYLSAKHQLHRLGVIIVDSTSMPMRRGTIGIALGHSGFAALRDYVGTPDLFGRKFAVSMAGVVNGLAATAVLMMGEGAQQTPIVRISDVPFVQFQDRNPTQAELDQMYISVDEDLYGPFLQAVEWKEGHHAKPDA